MQLARTVADRCRERVVTALTRFRSPDYMRGLYEPLHERGEFRVDRHRRRVEVMRDVIPALDDKRILDFGCGGAGGLRTVFGDNVTPYDPYVPAFARSPWHRVYDIIYSSDVLEHLTRRQIAQFLGRVRAAGARYVFLCVSTRRALKRLSNGANAHLTVKPAEWWRRHLLMSLGADYRITFARADLLVGEAVFCLERESISAAAPGGPSSRGE